MTFISTLKRESLKVFFSVMLIIHFISKPTSMYFLCISLKAASLPRKLPPVILSVALWNLFWNLCIRFSHRLVISKSCPHVDDFGLNLKF